MSQRLPASMSWCHAGWNSTSSSRRPNRSCVRSTGGFSFASRPHSCGSPPQNAPASIARSEAQPPPSRSSASTSGALSRNRLRFSSGGTWLKTSWVARSGGVAMDIGLLGDRSKTEANKRRDQRVLVGGVGLRQYLADRAHQRDRDKVGVLRRKRAIEHPFLQCS